MIACSTNSESRIFQYTLPCKVR